ncbi:23S rRNA (guanine(745)-N(1))-methyltransferase [Vibrio sp. V27_P1S3P104]|uniref:23S rRNA (guanine(745)-N(1))-methyltransferase n=1 Tax=unclassified Vibrio TaxID=2614977 RepID=UPI001373689B|nr:MULTISPECIES: 23S rRNA (guanine(745)-N(1))-methyltransferase [unclassified Vibrio]NAW69442.1 23S rRNA (guanine(745)-N(1))-methyltransferase [Vibrio sp. V28_P6S34P95]NAX05785.1 23S rRNA (guanine(745)-N(1))-methyltransferase [Vibrio sp. V30_P3S12P165]NAX35001.1 23S rRNA (guanine(745)-N(1))-methyltransferase [Vibrio sp. V29_P1S30P107]NAX38413.1 23S rRNA (guanine(745)-N(1))-methyltransferase [Vibrio sp. V27_P1S3P104]NAX39380.1 23S rRNA (guanine(745)-N(1))-methyltransferase [Vibrio sp. V26_P1S5P
MAYLCPLCHHALHLQKQSYCCDNRHQFDVAKEGYVNLMPAHHKRSKDPGDNKEMMQARRRFLQGHHYHPMREAVSNLCIEALTNTAYRVLDIGCGEGYYTDYIAAAIQAHAPNATTYGIDISKIAIRYAAKCYPTVNFAVASSHRLPFANQSLDAILRIYAPCKEEEIDRVLMDNGVVITVTPAGRHLYQLKEKIYQHVQLHDETPEQLTGFNLEHQQPLHYTMSLSGSEAVDLLQMTPFAWRATDALREELKQTPQFTCEADFMIRVYRKQSCKR